MGDRAGEPADEFDCAPTPDEILAQRLAAAEIDAAGYHERLEVLHGRARPSD